MLLSGRKSGEYFRWMICLALRSTQRRAPCSSRPLHSPHGGKFLEAPGWAAELLGYLTLLLTWDSPTLS